jgi:hypothetical protein
MSAMLESLKFASVTNTPKNVRERPPRKSIRPFKQDFLDMEQRWLSLARSFEFNRRLGDFSAKAGRRTTNPASSVD